MKLQRLNCRNFRCFDETEIDLSADIIALYGRNGVGKTAIFDAIEFGLLGNIGRFEGEIDPPDYIPNVHTDGDVEIRIEFSDQSWIQVQRDRSSKSTIQLSTSLGTNSRRGFLYNAVVAREYSPARKEISAVADLFRSTVLLSQHSIRSFIEGEPDERSRVISNLAGSAYFLRCLDKATAVQKEAEKKATIEQSTLDEVVEKLSGVHKKIAENDSRIAAARESLDTEPVQFSSVEEALNAAAFPVEVAEPKSSDEAEALLAALVGVRDELSLDLNRRIDLLSELSSLALSHPKRLLRQKELRKNIQDSNTKLNEAQKKEADLREASGGHDRTISTLDSKIRQLENYLTSLSNLGAAITRRNQIEKELGLATASANKLNEDRDPLAASVRRLENQLLEARHKLSTSEQGLINAISEKSELQDISASMTQYSQAQVTAQEANARYRDLQIRKGELESQLLELREQLRSTEARISELSQRKSVVADKAQDIAYLLSQLRNYVEDSICPLCGHNHSSQSALLSAIEERLHFVPPEVRDLATAEQTISATHDATRGNLARVNQELESIDAQSKSASEEARVATEFFRTLEERASRLGILLESSSLRTLIVEREKVIESTRQMIDLLNKQIADDDAQHSFEAGRLELTNVRLQDEREKQSQLNQELESVKLSIVGLRLDGVEIDPTEDRKTSIRSELEREQASRARELAQHAETQANLNTTTIEIRTERENINAWQNELSEIVREVESYETKCRRLGISPDASSDTIEQTRLALSERKQLLEKANMLLDQYSLSLKVATLEAAHASLQVELNALEAQIASLESNRKKYFAVVQQSRGWVGELSRNIDNVVERRIESHAPEINRLFRSMIPTPYLYEGVALSRRNGGLGLGLQYAGLKHDSGEPKFYLSNAQANVLALSLFLSFALRNRWTKLQTILLDDPIQHLDDLDAVAFLDNIRSVALGLTERKQIIMSTCDQDLYLLMIRKFRLLSPNGIRFTAISLSEKSIGTPQINYDIGGPLDRLRQAG